MPNVIPLKCVRLDFRRKFELHRMLVALVYLGAFFVALHRLNAAVGDEQWDGQFFDARRDLSVIRALATDANGRVIIGGTFGLLATSNGKDWLPIGAPPLTATIHAVAARGNEVFVGGSFTSIGGSGITNLARWDGTNWYQVGGPVGPGSVRALAFMNGDLIAGGTFTRAGGVVVGYIARWDGTTWHNMGGGVSTDSVTENLPPVAALEVVGDTLYAGGHFNRAGGVAARHVARWDGNSWQPLGSDAENGVDGNVFALAADPAGNLYVGGDFSTAGTIPAGLVAKWNGTAWSALGGGLYQSNPGRVNALYVRDGVVWAGGGFSQAGSVAATGLATWDGTNWSAPDLPVFGCYTMAGDGSDIYISAGSLTGVMTGRVPGLVKVDRETWSIVGAGIKADTVDVIAAAGDKIQIGGAIGGNNFTTYVAEWDERKWTPFPAPLAGRYGQVGTAVLWHGQP